MPAILYGKHVKMAEAARDALILERVFAANPAKAVAKAKQINKIN